MSRRFISLLLALCMWSSLATAGLTLSPFLTQENRQLFGSLIQAIRGDDLAQVRFLFEENLQALDCLHLPGVEFNGFDVNAIEVAILANRPQVLRYLLNYARDNHLLGAIDLVRARHIAASRRSIECLRIIEDALGVNNVVICAIQ